MGGVVSSIGNAVGDVVGGVGGLASGAVGAIPGVGKVLGPVASGITGGPLGFASSLAFNAATGQYGGGGGGGGGSSGGSTTPTYAQPNISYGNQTYQYGNNPVDASKYFITGDRGVYNLLPALGQINAGNRTGGMFPNLFPNFAIPSTPSSRTFSKLGAANAYTPYEAYQDIQSQLANDPTALAAFNKAFTPSAVNTGNFPANSPLGQFYASNPNPFGQNVNFNLNSRIPGQGALNYNKLANYAVENQNPFFLPFETTQGATPMGFTPSASALAPVDTSGYLSGYNTARTAQNQFIRNQLMARQAQEQTQRQAQRQARELRRQNERNRIDDDDERPRTPIVPPVTPTPVTPAPVTPNPVTPAPVTPTPVTPTPVTPPVNPGSNTFTPMRRGGIAALRRR